MKKFLKKLCLPIFLALFISSTAYAAINIVPNGGTGVGTITGIPYGTGTAALGIVTVGSGLSFTGGTLSSTEHGTVISVSGTTNRITSTGGTTPVIDISAAYVGQSSITTLGTIGTGIWQGTAIGTSYGGTGCTSTSITCFNNITGFSAAGTTGTTSTNLVFSTSPTLVTPNIGAATASGLTLSGITGSTQCLHVNSSGVVSGTSSDCGAVGSLTIGSTTINSGTNGRILYDNSGVIGELATIGSGNVVLATSPTLVTPALGTPTALVATNATGTATGLTSGITQALKSASTTVDVSAATAPSTGQFLTATDSTHATWQTVTTGDSATAAMDITAGQVVAVGKTAVITDAGNSSDTINAFGKTSLGNIRTAWQFYGSGVSMSSLKVRLKTNGSPSDNAIIRVETDSGGSPSGTLADANASAIITSASLSNSYVDTTVTFSGAFTPSLGTPYWLVFQRSGSTSNSDYYFVGSNANNINALNQQSSYTGSWASQGYSSAFYCSSAAGFLTSGIIVNQIINSAENSIIGIAQASASAGSTVSIAGRGQITTAMSGLQPGYFYVTGSTPGTVSTPTLISSAQQVIQAINSTTAQVIISRP